MPKIKNIRIINAQYDDGKKMYQDFIMPFDGYSATYKLGNGGGKSVLLMLLMQCIIPNYTLDPDKPFKSIFKKGDSNRTTHVLVEWILDSELCTHKTLLTGFCAKKKSSPDEFTTKDGIDYFNYTHLYDSNNEFDIHRIPLCEWEGDTFVVKSLTESRKLLRENSDKYDLWIGKPNGKGEYQEQIKKYCILGAEGKLIGSINGSENHLKSYFKRSYGTSRTVIEKLLLNTTIECLKDKHVISGNEHEESSSELLADTLYQSQEDIKRLNEELENIKETKAFHAEILKLTDANNHVANTHRELDNTKQQTSVQYLAHKKAVIEKRKVIGDIGSKLNDTREQHERIELDIDKLEIMQLNARVNNGNNDIIRLETEKTNIDDALKDLNHKSDLAIATNKFIEIQKCQTEILEDQKAIENISKDNEAIFNTQNTCGKTLHFILSKDLDETTTQYNAEKSVKEELDNESEQLQQTIGGINTDIKNVNNYIIELNIEIDEFRKTESELDEKCRAYPQLTTGLFMPDNEIDATNSHIDELKDKQVKIDETVDQLNISLTNDAADESRFTEMIKNTNEKIETANNDISNFESQRIIVMNIVNVCKSQDVKSCFDEIDAEISSTHNILSAQERDLEQLKQELRTVEEYGFALTKDFENALTWFREKFKFAKSGAEHLKDMKVEKQKSVLEYAPWLPKAIILANEDFKYILANPTSRLTKSIMDSSIILINLSSLQENKKISLGDIFVPSRDAEHYVKILDRDNTINRIKTKIHTVNQEIVRYEKSLEIAKKDQNTLNGFIHQYPDGIESELHNTLEKYQSLLNEYTTNLSTIKERIDTNKKVLIQAKTDLTNTKNRLDMMGKKLIILQELSRTITNIIKAQANLNEKSSRLKQLDNVLTSTKNNEIRLKAKITEKGEMVSYLSRQKEKLENDLHDLDEYRSIDVEILSERDTNILWAEFESAKKTIANVAGSVNQLKESIQRNKNHIQTHYTDIKRRSVPIDEIKSSGRSQPYTEEYIDELDQQIDKMHTSLSDIEDRYTKVHDAQILLDNKFENIQNDYNSRAPEEYVPNPILTDENQFNEDITHKQIESSRLIENITHIESLYHSNNEELNDLGNDLKNYEMLCDHYHIDGIGVEMSVELVSYKELKEQLKNGQSSVEKSKEKFTRTKEKVLSNVNDMEVALYFKNTIRNKLFVANNLKEAEFNAKALEKYSNQLLSRIKDQQEQVDSLKNIEENVVTQALGIAKMYKDYIKKFPMLSKIKFNDEIYEMIRINFNKCEYKDEQAEYEMRHYIKTLIQDIENEKISKIDLVDCLTPAVLLNKVIDMKVIKMEMRKIDEDGLQKYLRWEQIEASDGETNAIFIVFLVVLMSYIRDIVIDRKDINTSKMLIIDNPFGSTSSPYLWEAIGLILEKNNVQLICPGHSFDANIMKYFPINIILTMEKSTSGRKRVGIKVHAKDETLNAMQRQQRFGQIQLDI